MNALSIDLTSLPDGLSWKLQRRPAPCALIGGLAVSPMRSNGSCAAGEAVAMRALIVDAANDDAKSFYYRFGFPPLTDDPTRPFLTLGQLPRKTRRDKLDA